MKTYLKTLLHTFTKHKTRFLSIIFMVLLSVGFISGLGSTVDKIDDSLSKLYIDRAVADFTVKSMGEAFGQEEVNAVKTLFPDATVETGASYDVPLTVDGETRLVRLYFLNEGHSLNRLQSVAKREAAPSDGIAVKTEQTGNHIREFPLGTQIILNFKDVMRALAEQNGKDAPDLSLLPDEATKVRLTVTETVASPLLFARDAEPSYTNPTDTKIPDNISDVNRLITLDGALYLPSSCIPQLPVPSYENIFRDALTDRDLSIALGERTLFHGFSKEYKRTIESGTQALSSALGEVRTLTLYDNYSFHSLHAYADKVMGITIVLMIAFLIITVLLVVSNMTRLLDEDRSQIATLRTLGYSGCRITFKYLLFAAVGTGIGGTGGYFVGYGVMRLLYYVFRYSFFMPPLAEAFNIAFFLITFSTIAVCSLASTGFSGTHLMRVTPAKLLRPKSPKAGKKVFLERIPLIWRLLSFRYKSTARNVLRYWGRFLMTVVAVAFSLALMMAGLAVLDLCLFHGFEDISLLAVSLVVLVFAGLIAAVVVYTLTSINISERNKELATLKVLGYHEREVAGYIYREIYIDTAIGLIVGYPLAALLIYAVFKVIGGLGTLGGVSWFMWLIAPALVLLFTALTSLVLSRKINKIDMNESLKANE